MSRRLHAPLCALLLVAAAVALGLHMRIYNFVTDDAFISFVYSRNLVEHGQLVFNVGEQPVEGYTNFLWTVFLALWLRLGWQPESSSIVWGTAFAMGTMGVLAWLSRRLRDDGEAGWSPWDAAPALLLAAVPGYACWSAGGLETQMFTFFMTTSLALYLAPGAQVRPLAGFCMGLAALTRPEGNLFFALLGAHLLIGKIWDRRWRPSRRELLLVALFLVVVIPHLLWRRSYYGYWVPNTFYIKSSGGAGTWGRGFYYLGRFIETYLLYWWAVPPLLALLFARGRGLVRLLGWLALAVPVFFLYVARVGGDFMGLYRFALPILPLWALAVALGLRGLLGRLTDGRPRLAWVPAPIAAGLLGLYVWHDLPVTRRSLVFVGPGASDNGIDTPGYLRFYTADRAAIGKWFGRHAQPDDYAAVGGAGAQVYYSRIRSLDCFGLSDEYIAHHVPPVSNRPGHQKYAPVEYQIARRPTIITSNYYHIGHGPLVREDAPEWHARGYHYVSAEIPGLSAPIYTFLKRRDRAIGPLPADTSAN